MKFQLIKILSVSTMLNITSCSLPDDSTEAGPSPTATTATETPSNGVPSNAGVLDTSTGGKVVISSQAIKVHIPSGHELHGVTADSNGIYMVTGLSLQSLNLSISKGLDSTFVSQCAINSNGDLRSESGIAWDGSSVYFLKNNGSFAKFSGADCSSLPELYSGFNSWAVNAPFTIVGSSLYWNRAAKYNPMQSPPQSTDGATIDRTSLTSAFTDSVMGNVISNGVSTYFGVYSRDQISFGVSAMTGVGSMIWSLHNSRGVVHLWKTTTLGQDLGWVEIPVDYLPETGKYPFGYFLAAQSSSTLILAIKSALEPNTVIFTKVNVKDF